MRVAPRRCGSRRRERRPDDRRVDRCRPTRATRRGAARQAPAEGASRGEGRCDTGETARQEGACRRRPQPGRLQRRAPAQGRESPARLADGTPASGRRAWPSPTTTQLGRLAGHPPARRPRAPTSSRRSALHEASHRRRRTILSRVGPDPGGLTGRAMIGAARRVATRTTVDVVARLRAGRRRGRAKRGGELLARLRSTRAVDGRAPSTDPRRRWSAPSATPSWATPPCAAPGAGAAGRGSTASPARPGRRGRRCALITPPPRLAVELGVRRPRLGRAARRPRHQELLRGPRHGQPAARRRQRPLDADGLSGPRSRVGAVVVGDGELLMIRRGHGPAGGTWSLPGGRVERGETAAEAVVREVGEETGLEGVCGPFLGWAELIERRAPRRGPRLRGRPSSTTSDPSPATTPPRPRGCRSTRWPSCASATGWPSSSHDHGVIDVT